MIQELLTISDVARRVDRSASTVRRWDAEGRLPIAAKTRGGDRLYRVEDVEAFLREREEKISA